MPDRLDLWTRRASILAGIIERSATNSPTLLCAALACERAGLGGASEAGATNMSVYAILLLGVPLPQPHRGRPGDARGERR